MIDTVLLMTLTALGWLGWAIGITRRRPQWWVVFFGPVGLVWLTWYFFLILSLSQPSLFAGGLEAGRSTVVAIVGGVWALLARPRPLKSPETPDSGGARSL